MKNLKLVLASVWAFIATACHPGDRQLSGRYAAHAESAYSIADDTLLISTMSLPGHTYLISDHTAFQRLCQGRTLPWLYRQDTWQATWNEPEQTLAEADGGRRLRPDDGRQGLWLGHTFYRRLP